MKILIISNNVFSKTNNMGKTLLGYFKDWKDTELAQLYIHSEIPTVEVCKNYYRVTDKDTVKSIFTRRSGKIFTGKDIAVGSPFSRTDTGNTAKLYQFGRKRTPFIYIIRNLWWKLGKWNTKQLARWLDAFSPEVVFFASGDYAFMYDIALKIARQRHIPLIASCVDDYYLFNKNEKKFLGKYMHRVFMRSVTKTMKYAGGIMCICDKMADEYKKLFGIKCYTLHTPASFEKPQEFERTNQITYIGNLGLKRYLQLIKIGKALKELALPDAPQHITVYSKEKSKEVLSKMTSENGIDFCGGIGADEVRNVIGQSMAVIHTESFDNDIRQRVRYSVSTKIADSLMSGTCIFAFAPADIASTEYLKANNAAIIASSDAELKKKLTELICSAALRKETAANAAELAEKNHLSAKNGELLRKVFADAVLQCGGQISQKTNRSNYIKTNRRK